MIFKSTAPASAKVNRKGNPKESNGRCLINGSWQAGDGAPLLSHSPIDASVIWQGRAVSIQQLQTAVTAARQAFPSWEQFGLEQRYAVITKFSALVQQQQHSLARLISRESGKVNWDAASEVAAVQAKGEISYRAYQQRSGSDRRELASGTLMVQHRPHGVVAVIGPYNFPAHLPNGHIIPALLAGNCVVFKPSEYTPMVGQRLCELWIQAGVPPGVISYLPGDGKIGAALAQHPDINAVLFTGGIATGLAIHKSLAGEYNKLLALELGGNNPLLVWDFADIKTAVKLIIQSAYISSGQRCTCARRLIIAADKSGDALLTALEAAIKRLDIGEKAPQPGFMGPVISATVADKLLQQQQTMLDAGAKPIIPMQKLSQGQAYLAPGLLDVTSQRDRLDCEIFGPLLQVIRVANFNNAISEANNTRFGLVSGILCDRREQFDQFYQQIRSGIINWNCATTGASGAAPFGGCGLSGNHRPAGFYAADYAAYPVASLQQAIATQPEIAD